MRILYTLNSGNPGGMEQHVLDLVKGMIENGHMVCVWCDKGPIANLYQEAGASVTTQTVNYDIDPSYIDKLRGYLKANRIEILHAHELKSAVNSLIAAKLAGTKIKITHTHTPISEWEISKIKKIPNTVFYSFIVNHMSDCEIALTESRKRVKVSEGIKPGKIEIIPNGIDVSRFDVSANERKTFKSEVIKRHNIPSNRYIFGNLGRITEEKGVEDLLRAFSKLMSYKDVEKENVHLLIAGGGKLEGDMKNLAKELNIKDNVTITGRFKDSEKVRYYSAMDAFVFPSLAEGFGIVMIEAMSVGLPIICSNLEVLEEVGGSAVFSYFEVGNYNNLTEKIHAIYVKKDMLGNVTQNSRERVDALFTLDKFVSSYLQLYTSLLEKK